VWVFSKRRFNRCWEKLCSSPETFFQPAFFGKLDDFAIKTRPKKLKFWGDEDNDFKNTSPKDFNESPHGLRGIEGNRSKSGVFSRMKNLGFERTRDSEDFSTRKDGLESHHGVTASPRTTHNHEHQEQPHEQQNSTHGRQETYEIDSNSKPRRAQGGMGLLSHSIHVQSLHKSMTKILTPREEKGGREGGAWEKSN